MRLRSIRLPGRKSRRTARRRLGRFAERLAAQWLRRHGYRVLCRNTYWGRDEADIVAREVRTNDVVVVEVRARRHGAVDPVSSLSTRKRRALRRLRAAVARDARARGARRVRLDLITVDCAGDRPRIRHYPDFC